MRRLLVLLVVPVLAVAQAGCGKDDVSPDPVAKAADATAKAGGAKVAFRGSIASGQLGRAANFKGTGVQSLSSRRGHFDFEFAGLGGAAKDFRMEMILDKLVIYMRSPILTSQLPKGKPWLKIDVAAASKKSGVDLGQVSQVGQNDPTQTLQYLRAVSGKVEKVGSERVRGVETTRYKADVDLRKYPDLLPKSQREAARAGTEKLIQRAGRSKIPTEVWIDERNRVRRQRLSYSSNVPGAGRIRTTQVFELYDFGTPVNVDVPPADESFDVTKLAGRFLQSR